MCLSNTSCTDQFQQANTATMNLSFLKTNLLFHLIIINITNNIPSTYCVTKADRYSNVDIKIGTSNNTVLNSTVYIYLETFDINKTSIWNSTSSLSFSSFDTTSYYYAIDRDLQGFSTPNDEYYFTNLKFYSDLSSNDTDTTDDDQEVFFNISSNYFQLYIIFDFISPALCIDSNNVEINNIDIDITSTSDTRDTRQVCSLLTREIDYPDNNAYDNDNSCIIWLIEPFNL